MEASAHWLSVVSPYEFCGSGARFRGSSTLWTVELLSLIPRNLPLVEVTVTLTVFTTYTWKYTYTYTYKYTYTCAYTYVLV